jgi:hypothetical protein
MFCKAREMIENNDYSARIWEMSKTISRLESKLDMLLDGVLPRLEALEKEHQKIAGVMQGFRLLVIVGSIIGGVVLWIKQVWPFPPSGSH